MKEQMRRFSLRTLIIASALAGGLIGYNREPIERFLDLHANSSPLTLISSAEEMHAALTSPNAIIFAHVDWSGTSVVARDNVTDFSLQNRQSWNGRPIDFYMLDLTFAQSQAPAYVTDWLTSDAQLLGLPDRGSGDVVWLQNGSVKKWLPAYDLTVDDLKTETSRVFGK